jgi:hypothetical protein
MIKLKNISNEDITLSDLGEQLLAPNEQVELLDYIKTQASNSSQIVTLLSDGDLAVIDDGEVQVTDLSWAINLVKGFCVKDKKTIDDKVFVQETSRIPGTKTCFSSQGDDMSDPTNVWGGEEIILEHNISDPMEQSKIIDFNLKENRTDLHEGYITWRDANFDSVSAEVIVRTTPYTSGSNTNYNLYNGYLIIPAAGDGIINVNANDIQLVEMPIEKDTGLRPQAFWNADYSTETHTFSNITPAVNGDGVYNMFGAEIVLAKLVNRILLLNTGTMMLQTADSLELSHNMRIRVKLYTHNEDHAWKASAIFTLHRAKTV